MPAWLAPQSMKMGTAKDENDSPPLEGVGVGCSIREGPTPEG
jgi:hypothetical protein